MPTDPSPGETMRWQCPGCQGGFPEPTTDAEDNDRCPWCGHPIMDLTGEYFTYA